MARFSPDGRYILTIGCDFNHYGDCNEQHIFILYWRIEDLAAEACRRLPRNFTRAEWVQYFPNEEYRATCPQLPIEPEPIAIPTLVPPTSGLKSTPLSFPTPISNSFATVDYSTNQSAVTPTQPTQPTVTALTLEKQSLATPTPGP